MSECVRKCQQRVTLDVALEGRSCQCRGPREERQVARAACLFLPTDTVVERLTCGHTLSDRCRPTDGQRGGGGQINGLEGSPRFTESSVTRTQRRPAGREQKDELVAIFRSHKWRLRAEGFDNGAF